MHEGVGATIFQSQIAVHALEMQSFGYDIEVWTFETTRRLYEGSRRNLEHLTSLGTVPVRLLRGAYVFVPLSEYINAFLLWYRLRRERRTFDLIHARSDYSAAVYSHIAKRVAVPMIWDCRGDAYAETVQALDTRRSIPAFVRRVVLSTVTRQEQRAGASAAAANFVSDLLKRRKAHSLSTGQAFVIPCAVSTHFFHFDPALRNSRRLELGYRPDDVVVVYSGAMTGYQGFAAYVDLVAGRIAAGDTKVRLLTVTPDVDRARQHLEGRLPASVYVVRTANYAEMNGYLNAADFGMLLREPNAINDVASPTKFGEYCLAGLPVIIDGNVEQAMSVSAAIGNQESYKAAQSAAPLVPRSEAARVGIAETARKVYGREYLNAEYVRLYETALVARAV